MKKLSVIIPAYNEGATIAAVLRRVTTVKFPCAREIIAVDDGSSDGTGRQIESFCRKHRDIRYYQHRVNQGKGAAVRTGIARARGDYVVIQDADLEYDPQDILRVVAEAEKEPDLVVYGSRLTAPPVLFGPERTPLLLHYIGNKFLSLVTSLLYGSWVTDMETGCKLFPRAAMAKVKLNARGFELEPEITAKLLKAGYKIKEIPITTKPRSYKEGKKLNTWRDGIKALKTLVKYRFTD
jgi:glycosyltransferase involved in cell wall biosynthesis